MTDPNRDGNQPAEAPDDFIRQLRAVAEHARARFDAFSKDYAAGLIDYQEYITLSAKNRDLLTKIEERMRDASTCKWGGEKEMSRRIDDDGIP